MNGTVVTPLTLGNDRSKLPHTKQGNNYTTFTLRLVDSQGDGIAIDGTLSGSWYDDRLEDPDVWLLTGAITPDPDQVANPGVFTWKPEEIDTQYYGSFVVTFLETINGEHRYTFGGRWEIQENKMWSASVLPPPPIPGAEYILKIDPPIAGNLAQQTSDGGLEDAGIVAADVETEAGAQAKADAVAAASVAKTGDTMTGDLSLTNSDAILNGLDNAGILERPYISHKSQGALVEGEWRHQLVTVGPELYDNSLRWTYNSQWNAATTNDSRIIDGEHTVLMGLESRWTSGVDPTTIRGQVEWYLRVSPSTTGPIANKTAFDVIYDMDNSRSAFSVGDDADNNNSIVIKNGYMRIVGYNTLDGGYGLKVEDAPIWAYGGAVVSGSQLSVEGIYGGLGSSQYSQWIKSQIYPTTGGQVSFLRVGDGKMGFAAENISVSSGVWVHGNSWTKNTTGDITRSSGMTITRPTIGNGNAALCFGNGNDVAHPGFANYNIYQINTDPNYFGGQIRTTGGLGVGNLNVNINTPIGATSHAMPLYNQSGTLQGYIPVYAAEW